VKLNLRVYLFVCLGAMALLPVLVLGMVLSQRAESAQIAQSDRETALAADALARETSLLMLSYTNAVRGLSRQVEAGGSIAMDRADLQEIVNAQHIANPTLGNMWVANADAISIAYHPPFNAKGEPNAGVDYSDRDYYKKVKATNATAYSRAQLGRTTGRPNLQIAEPIRDKSGQFIGFSQGVVDLGEIEDVAERVLAQSPGLRAVVLDAEGRVLAHPSEQARLDMTDLSAWPLYRPSADGNDGTRIATNEDGVSMRAATAVVMPGVLDWRVLVMRPEAEVEAHAADIRRGTVWTAGLALLAALVMAAVFSSLMSRPITKLATVLAAVGEGDFSREPPSYRSWYPREVGTLLAAFAQMIVQLRARTEELERRVAERTAELTAVNHELDSNLRELRIARDEAEAAEERYKSLFENNPDLVYSCDLEAHFLQTNAAAAQITGYDADEILAMSRSDLVVPEDVERAHEHFKQAAQGAPQNYDIAVRHKDGRRVELNVTNLPIVVGGEIVGVYGISKDVTERNALAAEVARLAARREADKLKSEFVSIASHEFRTPLASLVGFTELLLDDEFTEEERVEWVQTMHKDASRLSHLVEELLDVSRIEDGGIELDRSTVDVKAVIEGVLASLATHASSHTFTVECADDLPPMLADRGKVEQVLTNLVSNAVKYSPSGGNITIAACASGPVVRLSVSDEGLGLPPEELPKLFGRFHRIQDSLREGIQGTGLGLYICKQLIELHDGKIWAESPGPEHGSTFTIELPIATEEMRHAA
jgi:PAS domain S-box-containing protein